MVIGSSSRPQACGATAICRCGGSIRHNLALLNGLSLFHGLGCPIVLGASRKRMIGALANEAPVEARLGA